MSLIINKKVHLEYSIESKMTFGIELFGCEVKSLRAKLGKIDGARVVYSVGQIKLLGAFIPIYQPKNNMGVDAERVRNLLATKSEIYDVQMLHHGKSLQIFPISIFAQGRFLKLECGIGKRLKKQDKREVIRKKDANKKGVQE
jgi:SsrA-binding protein